MKIISFSNQNNITEKEGKQLAEAIKAFEEGDKQPEGRFKIIGRLGNDIKGDL